MEEMKDEEDEERHLPSPSSSPPTPPSPLPLSVAPGNLKYAFSSSPSPSSPFSSPPSSSTSAERLPLLRPPAPALSAFSLDAPVKGDSDRDCVKGLVEWLLIKCCKCCFVVR